ncbi:contact-dependent growth inhibition system immunity protein [Andreprevotia chitinilytica]|uniref:contact-dependent growth inhibition system immunity protein n=1 Tax=Andreprevotia chitinilytica TaxID=396808 RepID=UPI000555E1BD|nr:contact-dependent growth inhibition system immunity protein [Andreprevotia chitinilytica]
MSDVVKKQWAAVYRNDEFIHIETHSGYRGGLPDPDGKRFLLSPDVADEELGTAVLSALANSRFLPPREHEAFFDMRGRVVPQYEVWVSELMARYGYKTKRALFKNMANCGIEVCEGQLKISPTHHEKLEAWSREKNDGIEDVLISSTSSVVEVGAALRLALSRCTG